MCGLWSSDPASPGSALRSASHQHSPPQVPMALSVAGKGTPSRGQREGSCLTVRNKLSEETYMRAKQETTGKGRLGGEHQGKGPGKTARHVARSLRFYGGGISFSGLSFWPIRALPSCKLIAQPRLMPVKMILGSGRTHGISF